MRSFQFKIGESATVRLELVGRDEQDRATYHWHLTDEPARIDHGATDLHLGPRLRPDNTLAAKTLLSDLRRAGEAYETELEGGIDTEALDQFPQSVNTWAYGHAEQIEIAAVELGGGLER